MNVLATYLHKRAVFIPNHMSCIAVIFARESNLHKSVVSTPNHISHIAEVFAKETKPAVVGRKAIDDSILGGTIFATSLESRNGGREQSEEQKRNLKLHSFFLPTRKGKVGGQKKREGNNHPKSDMAL